MSDLDLHQLRVFIAVSRHGSVARASAALRLTASPVSRTLRELEGTTGQLFERRHHDMRPTERGQMLLPAAVGVIRRAEDLLLSAQGKQPPIRWAATPWVPERFALTLRAALKHDVAIECDGAMSSVLLHRMVHGELDIAIVHLPVTIAGLESAPIAEYLLALAAPPGDPLAVRSAVRREDLRGRRVLLLPHEMQPEAMVPLHEWARDAGAESVDEVGLADIPLLANRLRREGAVTFGVTSIDTIFSVGPGLHLIPFQEDPFRFLLGLAWRQGDPVRDTRLREVVQTIYSEHGVAVIS